MRRPNWKRNASYVALLAGAYLFAILFAWFFGNGLDNYAYDTMFNAYRARPWTPEVVVLAIDEPTLQSYGGFRSIRTPLAKVLPIVAAAKPKVVAVDVLLADRGEPGPDKLLAAALNATPNLVLSSELVDEDRTWENPLPEFIGSASLGHVHAQPDKDGITRAILIEQRIAPSVPISNPRDLHRWAFALEAFRVSHGARIVENTVFSGGLAKKTLQVGSTAIPVQLGYAAAGGDPKRLMRVRYFPPGMTVPRVSIKRLIDDPSLASRLTGKAVFIGLTAQNIDIRDRLFTPLSNTPGIEINAAAYETIARGSFITDLGFQWVIPISMALMVLTGLSFRYLPGWWAYLAGACILLLAMVIPYVFFTYQRVFPFSVSASVAWLGTVTAASYYHLVVRRNLRIEQTSRERYQQAMHFVTHEMRTPLSAIQGSSELISRFPLTEDKRKQVALLINSESKRLARMVEIFLNVERLSAGQMELKREAIPVTDMVAICAERVGPVAARKHITVTLQPIPQGLTLAGDRELMEYACYNLLTNAVKYSPQNTEVLVSAGKQEGQVRIAIQDQGIGMDQKEVKQIFQKFYRTKKAEESGEAGTGIGLSIVQQIVEQHGGRIDVTSQPGHGSCFTLVLPAPARRYRRGTTLMQRLLLVEDDPALQFTIQTALEASGYEVDAVCTTGEAIQRLTGQAYPIVISDIYIDERTGIDVLHAAKRNDPKCAVILMTGRGTVETVMAATRGGAFDYIAKPFELDTMIEAVNRAEASRTDNEKEAIEEDLPESQMIGSSAAMVEIYKKVTRVAPTDATVVIEGETGTGKELVARMIHSFSGRSDRQLVCVDCASIAPSLLESELFGAVRGAFTGADRDRVGIFEAAHRSTVFLDEIGEIEKNFQASLLRFLQEREIRPVGASRAKEVDVRVIAATNRDLQRMVDEGKFREDLWYRLNTVRIVMPPLRERRDDIPLLARFYVNKYNGRYDREVKLKDSGVRALQDYTWPGNVRQLQHVIERLTILADRIDKETVEDALTAMESRERPVETLADAGDDQIRKVLAATGGNKSKAAQILGIERKTLYRKLERMKP